jgi:hypothetical protein
METPIAALAALALGILTAVLSSKVARGVFERIAKPPPVTPLRAMPDWGRDVIYGAAMVLGILGKEVWDHVNEHGRAGLDWTRLTAALIVAPVIYASVHDRFVPGRVSAFGLAVAFQNGFFWQAVFANWQR